MKEINTGFEIIDSAAESLERCICSEDSAGYYYTSTCGCGCGCKGPSSDADNYSSNRGEALVSNMD
jgi:hypothetical protein